MLTQHSHNSTCILKTTYRRCIVHPTVRKVLPPLNKQTWLFFTFASVVL